MIHSTATATATKPSTTSAGLRSLHLVRGAFSLVWVVLVLTTSSALVAADEPSVAAAGLLVLYPLWDVVATLAERRVTGLADRISTFNVVLGLAATVAMVIAVAGTIGDALLVFGIWAFVSGAVQLVVAIRRRRTVGSQVPMIISGGLSVLAGAGFAAMSGSDTAGLSGVAGYSAFGAFWFLVSAVLLERDRRRAPR